MNRTLWRQNFSIRNCHYHMAAPAMVDMMSCRPPFFQGTLTQGVWVQKGDDNIATYFPSEDLRAFIKRTIALIIEKPALINGMHRETIKRTKEYFRHTASLLKKDFRKMDKKRLIAAYNGLTYWQMAHHGWSIATTWFVDSDGEDFSRLLMERAVRLAEGTGYEAPQVFSILTTPDKSSLALQEEEEALRILMLIKRDRAASRIFAAKDPREINSSFSRLSAVIRRKIKAHFNKWHWSPFTYMGPAYELDYYLSIWSGWLRERVVPEKRIAELEKREHDIKRQKAALVKILKINRADRDIFKIAADIIYIKAYRKDAIFYGMYALDKLLREIGRRLGLSIGQMRALAFWEVPEAVRKEHFSSDILNKRREFSVYHQDGNEGRIYTGVRAKRFLAGLNIEKVKIKKTTELNGTVACPGRAKGSVKIINLPEEMGKMREGDIMVAHTTFPSLVPAMKKAAAIITDDGGITCHAAIVSRELKTPCVVGTKIATQVLKDGDKVEVLADEGKVKLLKK